MSKRIIDIPEELLTEITRVGLLRVSDEMIEEVDKAIQNGKPLTECDDCINREYISNYVESHIQEINTGYDDLNAHTNKILRMIVDYITEMPSVYPKNDNSDEFKKYCKETMGVELNDDCTVKHSNTIECDAEDYISRKQAQDELYWKCQRWSLSKASNGFGQDVWNDYMISSKDAMQVLKDLPSVYPKSELAKYSPKAAKKIGECNLCDSCTNMACEFQSGIKRSSCAFYMPPNVESDNCGNYTVQKPSIPIKLNITEVKKHQSDFSDLDENQVEDCISVNTKGLDEGIRCAMCTNSMKSDRGCDGGCVVNNAMYKKVMDVIENHIVDTNKMIEPTTKNNLEVDCVVRQDVKRYIEGFINEYTPKEELEFINLELDGLKHLPSVTPQEPVLDKIRAEIAEYGSIMVAYAITKDTKTDKGIEKLVSDVLQQAKEEVLEIIDKYKGESEDKE